MLIKDSGFIISQKKFGENLILVNILSKDNGLLKGLWRITKNKKIILFENVSFNYRTKNINGLGYFKIETNYSVFNLKEDFISLLIKASIGELCHLFIPANEKNIMIYKEINKITQFLYNDSKASLKTKCREYILFELRFLKNIGYGLNISRCVVSGSISNLKFISPKSGCAVSEKHGLPFKNKLFKLPEFFIDNKSNVSVNEIIDGFKITSFFLKRARDSMTTNRKLIFRDEILKKIQSSFRTRNPATVHKKFQIIE